MLYKDVPFVRYTLPLMAGILLCYVLPFSILYIIIPAVPLILLSVLLLKKDLRRKTGFGLTVYLFFIVAGYILYDCKYTNISCSETGPAQYSVRIDRMPVVREKSIRVPASLMRTNRWGIYRPKEKIMLYFPPTNKISSILPGSIIDIYLEPLVITDFNDQDNFDYSKYMLHQGYRSYAFAKSFTETGNKAGGILHKSIIIQHRLLKKYSEGIRDHRSLAIVSALTLGYRDTLDEEIREKFTAAGLSHIMAVSGLHVGIILIMITGFLKILRLRSRLVSLIIILISVWSFALISGLSPSVCRASIMLSFISMGKHIGRQTNPINSLFASAFIMLIANPFMLFSVSFQLSYSAVLTILLFFRKANSLVNFSGFLLRKTWSLISVTLLAQIGTLPFVLFHFKSVPVLSVVSNIFAVPFAFLIILTGIAFLLTPSGFFISDWLSSLIVMETRILYSLADWISSI